MNESGEEDDKVRNKVIVRRGADDTLVVQIGDGTFTMHRDGRVIVEGAVVESLWRGADGRYRLDARIGDRVLTAIVGPTEKAAEVFPN